MIKDAFFQTCQDARAICKQYVSLYVKVPFYGGPQEGGWWGADTHLIAYQECLTEEKAELLKQEITKLADELSENSKKEFGERCLKECEWLEKRGLDDSFLPEVDGELTYMVIVEQTPGENVYQDSRHWE